MEHDVLRQVYQHPLFQQQDLEMLFATHEKISCHKGDFLLRKGQVSNTYYIVEFGLLRSFVYDYEGHEITTDFMCNNELVIEVASIFHRIPTNEYIQCLTDCTLWKIDVDAFQSLFETIPALAEWGRAWMAYQLFLGKKRSLEMISLSASDRYQQLLDEKPQILQQAPLKHIATYLGITDTSLSRIRKEIVNKP